MWGWIFLWIALPIIYAGISLAPWVPTRKRDIERLQDILRLQSGECFLEIGCGDARVCRAIAKMFPKNEIFGIELAFTYISSSLYEANLCSSKKSSSQARKCTQRGFFTLWCTLYFWDARKTRSKNLTEVFRRGKILNSSYFLCIFPSRKLTTQSRIFWRRKAVKNTYRNQTLNVDTSLSSPADKRL